MKQIVAYNKDILEKILKNKGFNFLKVKFIEESEDDYLEKDSYIFTNLENIKEVTLYSSLWKTKYVKFNNEKTLELYPCNMNNNKPLLSINENNIISPNIILQKDLIITNNDFEIWLNYNNISQENLKKTNIELYEEFEYNLDTPLFNKKNEISGYSSELLKINEKDIYENLKDIKNKKMKTLIQYILFNLKN